METATELKCMNCGTRVAPKDGLLYLSVFVCPTCKEEAEILRRRARKDLSKLLTLLDETIRLALVEGRLKLSGEDGAPDKSKREVLMTIMELLEAKQNGRSDQAGAVRPRRRAVEDAVPEP